MPSVSDSTWGNPQCCNSRMRPPWDLRPPFDDCVPLCAGDACDECPLDNISTDALLEGAVCPSVRRALMDLYETTQGASWYGSANWAEGDPCADKWYNVGCDTTQHVARVT
jgi:hypothetical protein